MLRQCLVKHPESIRRPVAVDEVEAGQLRGRAAEICGQLACLALGHLVAPVPRGLAQAALRLCDRGERPAGTGLPLRAALLLAAQLQSELLPGLTVALRQRKPYSELQSRRSIWRHCVYGARHRASRLREAPLGHLGVQQLEEVLRSSADPKCASSQALGIGVVPLSVHQQREIVERDVVVRV